MDQFSYSITLNNGSNTTIDKNDPLDEIKYN